MILQTRSVTLSTVTDAPRPLPSEVWHDSDDDDDDGGYRDSEDVASGRVGGCRGRSTDVTRVPQR
eukprot:1125516-Rhodomonas_salina.1